MTERRGAATWGLMSGYVLFSLCRQGTKMLPWTPPSSQLSLGRPSRMARAFALAAAARDGKSLVSTRVFRWQHVV
jgi:hypothetical protein